MFRILVIWLIRLLIGNERGCGRSEQRMGLFRHETPLLGDSSRFSESVRVTVARESFGVMSLWWRATEPGRFSVILRDRAPGV